MINIKFDEDKPVDLELESLKYATSLHQDYQDIITDNIEKVMDLFQSAQEQNIEFTENDIRDILVREHALCMYLLNKSYKEKLNESSL